MERRRGAGGGRGRSGEEVAKVQGELWLADHLRFRAKKKKSLIFAQMENKVVRSWCCFKLFVAHRHRTEYVHGHLRITSNTITTLYKQSLTDCVAQ